MFDDFEELVKKHTLEIPISDERDLEEYWRLTVIDFLGSITVIVSDLLSYTLRVIDPISRGIDLDELDRSEIKFLDRFSEMVGKTIGWDYGILTSALKTILKLSERLIDNRELAPIIIIFKVVLEHLTLNIFGNLGNLGILDTENFKRGADEFNKLIEEVLLPNYNLSNDKDVFRLLTILMYTTSLFSGVLSTVVLDFTHERIRELGGINPKEVPDERA